jgi:hypothetical protein
MRRARSYTISFLLATNQKYEKNEKKPPYLLRLEDVASAEPITT